MLGLGVRVRSNIEQNGSRGLPKKGAFELQNPLRRVFLTGGFRFVVTLSMATLKKLCSMNLSQSDLY